MASTASPQFTLYTSNASQWAYAAHLALAEKGYDPSRCNVNQIGLVDAENFAPEYVKMNPNGTIPSFTSASLQQPLVKSADTVRHLDSNHQKGSSLFPVDPEQRSKAEELIAYVHQPQLSTNLILLQARDVHELNAKKAVFGKISLTKYGAAHPEIRLYLSRSPENGKLYHPYNTSEIGPGHEQFFDDSHQGYKDFAAGLSELNSMLVLPYAVGDKVMAAEMHIIPWFAYALWGCRWGNNL